MIKTTIFKTLKITYYVIFCYRQGRKKRVTMRLSEAFETYSNEYIRFKNLSPKTDENYRTALASILKSIPDKELTDLTFQDVMQWRNDMASRGLQVSSIRVNLSKLKNVLLFGVKRGHTDFNVDQIELPKVPQRPPHYLQVDDVTKLIEAAENIRDKAIIALFFSSGIRCSELTRLNRRDYRDRELFVHGKGNVFRTAYVDDTAYTLLEMYLASRNDGLEALFVGAKHQRLLKDTIELIVRSIAEKAGIPGVTPHVLRHSYATSLAQQGIGAFHLQKLLGHAHISTTQIYVHLTSQDAKTAYQEFHVPA
jgi:site-specific recombinase XerD